MYNFVSKSLKSVAQGSKINSWGSKTGVKQTLRSGNGYPYNENARGIALLRTCAPEHTTYFLGYDSTLIIMAEPIIG